MRRELRENKEVLKTEDPFLYYFGRPDPDRITAAEKSRIAKRFKLNERQLSKKNKERKKSKQRESESLSINDPSSSLEDTSDPEQLNSTMQHRQLLLQTERFRCLPEQVRAAIELSHQKQKHSEFYYRLRGLNERIKIYKENFYEKVPSYQKKHMKHLSQLNKQ